MRLRWLTAEEGGRRSPPAGPRYVAEARFAETGPTAEAFGVVLDLTAGGQLAAFRLLAPEQVPAVAERIRQGVRLSLLERGRVVAEAEVRYVPADEPTGD